MTWGIARGALAGAAGTTALNAATYLDMALRGRPASDSTEQLVEKTSEWRRLTRAMGLILDSSGMQGEEA